MLVANRSSRLGSGSIRQKRCGFIALIWNFLGSTKLEAIAASCILVTARGGKDGLLRRCKGQPLSATRPGPH